MGNRLEGKVAVVSGGGRGIGRAVALLLAEEKASVVVNDLGCEVDGTGSSHEPADGVAAEITRKGGKAVASYQDTSTMAGGEAVVQKAMDTYGRLDILVNSAGVRQDRMIFQMRPDEWDAVIRNTLKAAFTTTRCACIVMRQQRSGRIVNLTGDAGLGGIGMSNQAAASEGVIGLTRTVARDMGRYGVTCNAVSAMAKTRLFSGTVEMYRASGARPTPDQRAGLGVPEPRDAWSGPGSPDDPERVATLVAYLCTDGAPNANGYVFGVRGGDIYVYTNPEIERSISKRGMFTLDELDDLVPRTMSQDMRNWTRFRNAR
ncbi:MAG: SDR family NAD(P)-dependent oxidoreductase [Dehalococcoidia bacterium]|nr:SDR family NAD(P)-dependent oxidoreductase [Dehalococcoidia bacterium]